MNVRVGVSVVYWIKLGGAAPKAGSIPADRSGPEQPHTPPERGPFNPSPVVLSPSGGTGRHGELKLRCLKRAGSIPATGTMNKAITAPSSSGQDAAFSTLKYGFESRWGCQL